MHDKKLVKVVHIITGLGVGGAERTLLKLLQGMDRDRFTAEVISLTDLGPVGVEIAQLGIPVRALGMKPGRFGLLAFARLVLQLRRSRPAIVQTWMYHSDFVGGIAARLAGIRRIAWSLRHSNLDPDKNKRATLLTVKLCAALSHRVPAQILSCSERARAIHVEAGYHGGKIVVIPNGVQVKDFKPDAGRAKAFRDEIGVGPDVPLVGLIGRYDPLKNHLGFVRAAALVRQAMPGVVFVLAGTGIDKDNAALVQAFERAQLAGAVHLLGPRRDIAAIMASLDVLALPSLGEAFPNVVAEAMSCAVPCVVTDVGDAAPIVGDTGFVVGSGDMDSMAARLLDVLRLDTAARHQLGARARQRVLEHFDIDSVVRRYERFYLQLESY